MLPKSKYTLRDGEYQSRAQKKYLDPEWKKIKIARKQAVIEKCKNISLYMFRKKKKDSAL